MPRLPYDPDEEASAALCWALVPPVRHLHSPASSVICSSKPRSGGCSAACCRRGPRRSVHPWWRRRSGGCDAVRLGSPREDEGRTDPVSSESPRGDRRHYVWSGRRYPRPGRVGHINAEADPGRTRGSRGVAAGDRRGVSPADPE
jgi:hypothetical protein